MSMVVVACSDTESISVSAVIKNGFADLVSLKQDLNTAINKYNNNLVKEEIGIKKDLRKIAYEKYRNMLDLIAMLMKADNDVTIAEYKLKSDSYKLAMEKVKTEKEMLAIQEKYRNQEFSTILSFVKDIFKFI